MPAILLAAATGAADSAEFVVSDQGGGLSQTPAHFTCPGIAGSETGTLQKKTAADAWVTYAIPNSGHIISTTQSGVIVTAPGTYRIRKSITAAAVPVEVSFNGNP